MFDGEVEELLCKIFEEFPILLSEILRNLEVPGYDIDDSDYTTDEFQDNIEEIRKRYGEEALIHLRAYVNRGIDFVNKRGYWHQKF